MFPIDTAGNGKPQRRSFGVKLDEATVLIVDDELELREIFSNWLGRKGCKVLTAANGAEALKTIEIEKIDVLVSDIRMPIMGGLELVRTIYSRGLLIPSIIFVSGFGDVEPREMYGLGVELLMEKPLGRKELLDALEESLAERETLWLVPSTDPMSQSLVLEIESFKDARQSCQFQLGRGGCCFLADCSLIVDKTIDLTFYFLRESQCLKAQGKVQWQEIDGSYTGVSFDYLYPGCRKWVIAAIEDKSYRSFIPQCRICK